MAIFKRKTAAPDLEDFDTAIRVLLAKYAPDGVPVTEGDNDSLFVGDRRTNLGNLRQRWSELEQIDRFAWLEASIADVSAQTGRPEAVDVSRLRPGVRSRSFLEIASLMAVVQQGHFDDSFRIPSRPLGGDLEWILIWDTPQTMSTVNNGQLEAWGQDFDTLFNVARSNFRVAPIQEWGVIDKRVFMPASTDDYLGSQLFLPGGLDALPFSEERVVFHPTRTSAVIASTVDPEGIAIAAGMARQLAGSAGPASLSPVVGRDGNWRALELPASHPAFSECQMLKLIDDLNSYGSQQGLLREIHGEDIFVATFSAAEADGVSPFSYCSWTKGADSLLPKTDLVAFVDLDAQTQLTVKWHDAVAICGHLLEPTHHYPERWRVTAFPSAEEFARLQAAKFDLGG